jgi:hypothetical protein
MEDDEGGEGCLGVGVESVSQCFSTSRDLTGGRSASL